MAVRARLHGNFDVNGQIMINGGKVVGIQGTKGRRPKAERGRVDPRVHGTMCGAEPA